MGTQLLMDPAWDANLLLARGQPAPDRMSERVKRLPFTRGQLDLAWSLIGWPPLDFWIAGSGWVYCPNEKYVPIRGFKSAVTVHDIYSHESGREHSGPAAALRRKRFKRMITEANIVLAVSEFTKARLVHRFGIDEAKIAVVGNGVEEEYFAAAEIDPASCRDSIPHPYVLFVGGLREKKGASHILQFVDALGELDSSVTVVVVGLSDPDFQGAHNTRRNLLVLDRGFPDDKMHRLVRGASVALSLSAYEGFGIPLLEAMAASVPVIAANRSAFPEVVGDAAPLVDPADSKGITRLVRDLIHDDRMRGEQVNRGRRRAEAFRWHECAARATLAMQAYDRGNRDAERFGIG